MAFNIMNVSNIEVKSIIGALGSGSAVTLIAAPAANSIIKIKSAKFIGSVGTFSLSYGGTQTSWIQSSGYNYGSTGVMDLEDFLRDFYMTEGNSLILDSGSSNPTSYMISYEIWT